MNIPFSDSAAGSIAIGQDSISTSWSSWAMHQRDARQLTTLSVALLSCRKINTGVNARLAGFHTDIESCDGDVDDGQNRSAELALYNM